VDVARKINIALEALKEQNNIAILPKTKDGPVEIFCNSKYMYDEIKDAFEAHGYIVHCGKLKLHK
jgi:hypothetical protein